MSKERRRLLVGLVATAAVLLPLGWFWQQSLLPSTYSVMDMGYVDYGGGDHAASHLSHHGTSVADLTETDSRPADVSVDLVARKQKVELASGREVDGYTLNGQTPGPTIKATVGQLVEVRLRNESVKSGVTLHWHGIDVPNAEDGVAGVTQNAVEVGGTHTYRFVVDQVGTYWYHSHQLSHAQVIGGLFGAVVVEPLEGIPEDRDLLAVSHTYVGTRTLNGAEGVTRVVAEPGDRVRIRVINTDNGTMQVWATGPYRVVAIDGHDLNVPTEVKGRHLSVPAGARADLEVTVPSAGAARVQVAAATAFVVGPDTVVTPDRPQQPERALDLLTYGKPASLPMEVREPDRVFDYSIGRRLGFLDGRPGLWWSINGHLYPDVPMFTVREGDVVKFHIENHSGQIHPMHLHGHHAVVISRDSHKSTGSPLWVDSVDVPDGGSVDLVFVADNPGIWMDHCHNLPHAADGLVAHLMYEGVTTPFTIGGDADNAPE